MYSKFVAFALLAAVVSAQDSSSVLSNPSGTGTSTGSVPSVSISACLQNCLENAQGCTSYTDLTCVCSSNAFQLSAAQCIQEDCPDELAQALALQASQCGVVGSSSVVTIQTSIPSSLGSSTPVGGSSTPSPTFSLSSTRTPGSSSPTPSGSPSGSPTPSGSAGGGNTDAAVGTHGGMFAVVGAAIAGVVGGGLLLL